MRLALYNANNRVETHTQRIMKSIARRKNRKGISTVEFAIVSPVMMLLLLGAIDAGQLVNVWHKVDNASREGARMALSPMPSSFPLAATNWLFVALLWEQGACAGAKILPGENT